MIDWAAVGNKMAKQHKVSKTCSQAARGFSFSTPEAGVFAEFTSRLPFYEVRAALLSTLLILIFMLSNYTSIFAETLDFSEDQASIPFQKDYLIIEAISNFPVSQSLDYFRPFQRTFGLNYTHVLSREWIVGVSGQFKSMRRKDIDREFALLTFSNQAQYVVRLYHPAYLLVGGKWLYMVASQRARFPLVRDPDYETEIGAGLSATFAYILAEDWLLTLRLDRWRGTNTNRLHGFEAAIGIGRSLDL